MNFHANAAFVVSAEHLAHASARWNRSRQQLGACQCVLSFALHNSSSHRGGAEIVIRLKFRCYGEYCYMLAACALTLLLFFFFLFVLNIFWKAQLLNDHHQPNCSCVTTLTLVSHYQNFLFCFVLASFFFTYRLLLPLFSNRRSVSRSPLWTETSEARVVNLEGLQDWKHQVVVYCAKDGKYYNSLMSRQKKNLRHYVGAVLQRHQLIFFFKVWLPEASQSRQ